MHPAPTCTRLGSQCRAIDVVLKVGTTDEGPTSADHEATWLLGHTGMISFGKLRTDAASLLVPATLHLPCRFLKSDRRGSAVCRAHGFQGPDPEATKGVDQPRQLGGAHFRLVQDHVQVDLPVAELARSLPVLNGDANPCATAPCRTADNTRGSACCRDLQIEILCTTSDTALEALVRSRRSPYLCKVARNGPESLDAEMISACDYLDAAGANCTLHGRFRPDGRTAKPDLCSDWPPAGKGIHPGCVFGASSGAAVGT